MDHYSILDQGLPPVTPQPLPLKSDVSEASAPVPEAPRERLRFPGEDGGKSLTEMALRDLNAALQLLAERAQYITGASGAAIALREGKEMICRASAGPSAPELGAHLQVESGLSGESVRGRKILRCDDVESDTRVNRESCRALGIASVMVMPLIREEEVNGVFELFSGTANAFEERDIAALERLAEMIQTAVEHAEAAKRAPAEIAGKKKDEVLTVEGGAKVEIKVEAIPKQDATIPAAGAAAAPAPKPAEDLSIAEENMPQVLLGEHGNIGKCEACGFPISEGRTLCLDCEKALPPGHKPVAAPATPAFLSQLAIPEEKNWLQSHVYVIGALLVVAITVLAVLWQR